MMSNLRQFDILNQRNMSESVEKILSFEEANLNKFGPVCTKCALFAISCRCHRNHEYANKDLVRLLSRCTVESLNVLVPSNHNDLSEELKDRVPKRKLAEELMNLVLKAEHQGTSLQACLEEYMSRGRVMTEQPVTIGQAFIRNEELKSKGY